MFVFVVVVVVVVEGQIVAMKSQKYRDKHQISNSFGEIELSRVTILRENQFVCSLHNLRGEDAWARSIPGRDMVGELAGDVGVS